MLCSWRCKKSKNSGSVLLIRCMNKLPQVSGSDVVRALQKVGFTVRRQHGSHIIIRRDNPFAQTVVPNPGRLIVAPFVPFCVKPASPLRD